MTLEYSDRLRIDTIEYRIDTRPLEPAFALYDLPLFAPIWPVSSRGYFGIWTLLDDHLVLKNIWPTDVSSPSILFPSINGPVIAHWYNGLIRGRGGDRRYTGPSAREFFNDEIVLEVVGGVVTRHWCLDLRGVPDQTDDEIRHSCPQFLWPKCLR